MNMSAELTNVKDAFAVISNYSTLNSLPVFIGEDDPDSCAACISPEVGYRNGLIFPSYTAAVFTREMDLAMKYTSTSQALLHGHFNSKITRTSTTSEFSPPMALTNQSSTSSGCLARR